MSIYILGDFIKACKVLGVEPTWETFNKYYFLLINHHYVLINLLSIIVIYTFTWPKICSYISIP